MSPESVNFDEDVNQIALANLMQRLVGLKGAARRRLFAEARLDRRVTDPAVRQVRAGVSSRSKRSRPLEVFTASRVSAGAAFLAAHPELIGSVRDA